MDLRAIAIVVFVLAHLGPAYGAQQAALDDVIRQWNTEPELVLRHRSALLRRSTDGNPVVAGEAAAALAKALIARGEQEAARRLIAESLPKQQSGTAVWARMSLVSALIDHAESRTVPAAMTAEAVTAAATDPVWRYRAALLAGQWALEADRPADARRIWSWADTLARKTWYADAPPDIDPAEARRRLAALDRDRRERGLSDADRLFAQAERARNERRWSEALTAYQNFQRRFATDVRQPRARWAEGACLRGQGLIAEAVRHWQAFFVEAPAGDQRGVTVESLVDSHLTDLGDLKGARDWIDRGLRVIQEHPPVRDSDWWAAARGLWVRQAVMDWIGEHYDRAEQAMVAAKSYPTGIDTVVNLAPGSAPIPGAMERLLAAIRARQPLVPAEARDSRHGKAILVLASAQLAVMEWRFAEAITTFERVVESDFSASSPQRAHALLQIGLCHHAEGRFAKQVDTYQTLLSTYRTGPAATRALLCLGVAQVSHLKDPEAGLATWADLIHRFPTSEDTRTALLYTGLIHRGAGRNREAERAWQQLQRLDPKYPWPVVLRDRFAPLPIVQPDQPKP